MNKKNFALAALIAAALVDTVGAKNIERLHISNLTVNKDDNALKLAMSVDPKEWRVASKDIVTLTPMLVSPTDTIRLEPMRIAGKQAWYNEVRNGRELPRAGKSEPFRIARERNHITDVLHTGHKEHQTLEAESES